MFENGPFGTDGLEYTYFENFFPVLTEDKNSTTNLENLSFPGDTDFDLSDLFKDAKTPNYQPNIVKVIFLIAFCVIGLFGNLVAIFVIVVLKEYQKSVTHWYVLQLAIAETIFLLTLPFRVSEVISNGWTFPEWTCKANQSILFLNYFSSIMFLVIMSIDRYIAVCRTFSSRLQAFRKRTSAFVFAVAIWAIALALCTPVMMYSFKVGTVPTCKCTLQFEDTTPDEANCYQEYGDNQTHLDSCLKVLNINQTNEDGKHCDTFNGNDLLKALGSNFGSSDPTYVPDEPEYEVNQPGGRIASNKADPECHYQSRGAGWYAFITFIMIAMFFVPLLIMVACYGMIIHRLHATRMRRTTSIASTTSFTQSVHGPGKRRRKSTARSDKDRVRVTIMCSVLVTSFLICWLPFFAIHLAKYRGISAQKEYCVMLSDVATFMAYLTAVINPYLYSFLGTRFLRRWSYATLTVSNSIRKRRTSSTSGAGGFASARNPQKKLNREISTSNNQTYLTKINKTENNFTMDSKPNTFTATVGHSEFQPVPDTEVSGSGSGTPPPQYEQIQAAPIPST